MHWTTKTEYVDIDTGEALTQRHVKNGLYIVINTHKHKTEHNENFGIKQYRKECRRNPQLEFKL